MSERRRQIWWRRRGKPLGLGPDQNAFHPRKGKFAERRRRKAMGLQPLADGRQAAEGMDR